MMTGKFPSVVVLTEFAAQLRRRNAELGLQWVPRDQNEEADALTNGHFNQFDPKLRMEINIADFKWLIMDKMLKVAEDVYQEVKSRREARRVTAAAAPVPAAVGESRRRPQERLRARDPW